MRKIYTTKQTPEGTERYSYCSVFHFPCVNYQFTTH